MIRAYCKAGLAGTSAFMHHHPVSTSSFLQHYHSTPIPISSPLAYREVCPTTHIGIRGLTRQMGLFDGLNTALKVSNYVSVWVKKAFSLVSLLPIIRHVKHVLQPSVSSSSCYNKYAIQTSLSLSYIGSIRSPCRLCSLRWAVMEVGIDNVGICLSIQRAQHWTLINSSFLQLTQVMPFVPIHPVTQPNKLDNNILSL